jgi:hypothetical protein
MAGIVQPQPFKTLAPAMHSGSALNAAISNGLLNYQDAITALAGGGAAGAPTLALGVNRLTVVATAADSVMLPPSGTSSGGSVVIVNQGVASTQVFANTVSSLATGVLDTINGTAGATGVAVANGKTAIFWTTAAGAWFGPVALA